MGVIMASEPANSSSGTQRTRRNLMKMGAIAAASTLATVHSASAGQGGLICAVVDGINDIFGTHLPCPSPKKGDGGGNCFLRGTKISDGRWRVRDRGSRCW